jgi:hypothetical protein
MKPIVHMRWMFAALALFAGAAAAQAPAQILVTREAQDLYRATAGGNFYIRTLACHEHVYEDRAGLRVNFITKGGLLTFRNGKSCVVDKFLQELDPARLNLRRDPF